MSLADPYGAVRDVRCAVGVVFCLQWGGCGVICWAFMPQ